MSTENYKTHIKCAVFDLDGTLLNTIKTITFYLNFALNKNGLGSIDTRDCTRFVGDGAMKLISRALEHLGVDVDLYFDSVYRDYNIAYDANPYYLTEPYDGVPEMLDELRKQGITLAVLSNKPDYAARSAVTHFFPGYFALVCGARDGIALKPDPTALRSMLSQINHSVEDTAYVGDSEQDVTTAINARVALGLSVSWGFRSVDRLLSAGATNIISHPSEVVGKLSTSFEKTNVIAKKLTV